MSTGKRIIPPYPIFTNGVMTGTATLTSPNINIQNYDTVGFQISWTGTPTGNLVLNGSGDGIIWLPLPGFSVNSPAGSAGGTLIDIVPTSMNWLQLVYTNVSSTGVLNAKVWAKAY